MKRNFILLACLGICLHAAAQSDVATARYMHVAVDGNDKEWGALNFYDEETQLNFAIANDADYVYVCFVTGSQAAQLKLMRAGMKVTFSTKGKPRHEAAIAFPLPQAKPLHDSAFDKNNPAAATASQPALNKENFRLHYLAGHTTMQLTGFATANGEKSIQDSSVHVALNWDSLSNMVYEIAIAKTAFYGPAYTAKDLKNDITLNVELNGLQRSETGDARYEKTAAGSDIENGSKPEGGGVHTAKMHPGVGFNMDKRPGSITDAATLEASLNHKTSFKQKFVLADAEAH